MRRLSLLLLALLVSSCTLTSVVEPLHRSATRPTALRFGMHVTPDPADNPIDPPERFTGYHVGLDFETFLSELTTDVPVYAICDGEVAYSGFAEGYGGLLTQHCTIDNQAVTVIYGHLNGDSLVAKGTTLATGDVLGKLADARSHWSDGNRKHLHLGIHKGDGTDVRGYVQTEAELADFIDPATVLGPMASGTPVTKFHVPETSAAQ